MRMKSREKKKLDDVIREIKAIPSYPPDTCFLTYCVLGDRLFYRLEKSKNHPEASYSFSTGDRETHTPGIGKGWVGFPSETYIKNIKDYIERRGLRVQLRKNKYHPNMEKKKRLTNGDVESTFNVAVETENKRYEQ